MTLSSDDPSSLTILLPITPAGRRTAEAFAQEQPTGDKTAQVYLNTLAVWVVNDYLQLLGIPTDLAGSYSWNPIGRLCANVADLKLPEIGHLECLAVQDGEDYCVVPPDVWRDRIGYVVVQVDETQWEGHLLGFVPSVTEGTISIQQLESLDRLLEHLQQPVSNLVQLRQWLNQVFEVGWLAVEDLLGAGEVTPALAFRMGQFRGVELTTTDNISSWVKQLYVRQNQLQAIERPSTLALDPTHALIYLLQTTQDEEIRWTAAEMLWAIAPDHPLTGAKRVIDLGIYFQQQPIALMVAILPKPDGALAVLVRAYPMGQVHLPPELHLGLLDATATPLLEIQSRMRDDYIQLKFIAYPGEKFCITIQLAEALITENFVA